MSLPCERLWVAGVSSLANEPYRQQAKAAKKSKRWNLPDERSQCLAPLFLQSRNNSNIKV